MERLMDGPAPSMVAFANAHSLNLASVDADYRRILQQAALVLNDGSGVSIAARLHGTHFPENLNGTDLIPRLLAKAAQRGTRVYLLGAAPGVARDASKALCSRFRGLQIVGCHDGFFPASADADVATAIRTSMADLLLVAMGNPLQELWLARNLMDTGVRLGVGVGAFFDFAAGRVTRAPNWLQQFGAEWIWRLLLEPRRMWRRYLLGNPTFMYRVLTERIRQNCAPGT